MTTDQSQIIERGLATVRSLILFAQISVTPGTTFESSVEQDGARLRELIQFRSPHGWGDLQRTGAGLVLKMVTNPVLKPNIPSRAITFPREAFAASALMNASHAEFAAAGGQSFCLRFAAEISKHQGPHKWLVLEDDEQHLLISGADQMGPYLFDDAEALARSLEAKLGPQSKVTMRHPAFDQPGTAWIAGSASDAPAFRDELAAVAAAAAKTLPRLLFTPKPDQFPSGFEVTPFDWQLDHIKVQMPDGANTFRANGARRIEERTFSRPIAGGALSCCG